MALLATIDGHDAADLLVAIVRTVAFQGTHPVPSAMPDPPSGWADRFLRVAAEQGPPWTELRDLARVVRLFLDPVLARVPRRWNAGAWIRRC